MFRHMKRPSGTLKECDSKIQKKMNTVLLESPIKSKSDRKEYRLISLENGLKALLIHHQYENQNEESQSSSEPEESDLSESESEGEDSTIREKLAAVALAINTGSFSDPDHIQGLAHFVEHMIFMGSKKYPNENELDQYLNAAGGDSNAFTECQHTLFYFDIVEEHLMEAIDRFSSLFIDPLMLRDSMSREIQAVESEFQNNINDDDNRMMQLYASKANDVAATFTWGNLKTLKEQIGDDDLYSAAHAFRSKYYIANNMCLSIESSESLDDLQKLVEKHFSEVKSGPTCSLQKSLAFGDYFKPEFYNKMLYVKPKGDKCKLFMTFIMPSMQKYYKSKPHDYLAYIIQHEGFGSLSSYLKQNLLALNVRAGSEDQSFDANSLFTLFGIEILLTEKGYLNIKQVLEAIFSVLLMLQSTPIKKHETLFRELKQIRDTSFNFQEEKTSGENTEEYAVNMLYYNSLDIITGPDMFYDFNGELVKQLIDIVNQGKFNLTILTDKHSQYPFTEKWFETEYDEIDLPNFIKDLWNARQLSSEFFMPQPNSFICTDFEIASISREPMLNNEPGKIFSMANIEVWYKLDDKFLLPHGFINCYLESPVTMKSARNIVLTSMYSMIIKYYLAEKLYPAICAGLGYSINAAEKGLLLKLNGYNEKLPHLFDIITKELIAIGSKIEEKVFDTYREQCRKTGYNNLINSKFVSRDLRLTILEEQHKFCLDQYAVTNEIKFEELVNFAKEFPVELYTKIMILGNFKKPMALDIAKSFYQNIQMNKKDIDKNLLVSRARKVIERSVLCVKSFLPGDKNSTITNYYQIGKSTVKVQCLVEFIEKLMQEPLFDVLRTKEQFGYSVSCSHRVNNGIIGFTVTLEVQEDLNSTAKVNERIEKFLNEEFKNHLMNLSVDEYKINQSSLIKLKMMEEVEMENENNRLWSEITCDEYLFTRLDLEAKMIEKLTLENVQDFYGDILKAPKLSIQVIGTGKSSTNEDASNNNKLVLKPLDAKALPNEKVVSDLNEFINSLDLYEKWKTLVDL